jgi:hypothetical protein
LATAADGSFSSETRTDIVSAHQAARSNKIVKKLTVAPHLSIKMTDYDVTVMKVTAQKIIRVQLEASLSWFEAVSCLLPLCSKCVSIFVWQCRFEVLARQY